MKEVSVLLVETEFWKLLCKGWLDGRNLVQAGSSVQASGRWQSWHGDTSVSAQSSRLLPCSRAGEGGQGGGRLGQGRGPSHPEPLYSAFGWGPLIGHTAGGWGKVCHPLPRAPEIQKIRAPGLLGLLRGLDELIV